MQVSSSVEGETKIVDDADAPPAVPVYKCDSAVWELDFCSRPIFDERKKKVWELLICDPERNFEYSEYFPNNKINSVQVSAAKTSAHSLGVPRSKGYKVKGCVNPKWKSRKNMSGKSEKMENGVNK
jgi:hypothetical protein